jgi:hypothetical protein
MKKIIFDPNNPASAIDSIRQFLTETQSVYQGMIDQVPEAFRAQVRTLKDKVDAALTTLASKPTDQVPAALDAASTLNHIGYMISSMQEMISGTMEALNKMVADYTPKATALQSLQGRIEKKELLEATEVEKRVTEANENGKKAERERQKVLSGRRSLLAKADVPLPIEDDAIDGDDKVFAAVQVKVTERSKKLKDLGLLSQLNAEDASKLIYGPDEQFNFSIALAEKAGKRQEADPFLGGGTNPEGKKRRLAIA